MDIKQIGKNITALRKSNNYTQEALAEKLGISAQAISKWETGAGLPEASLLIALSELFQVTIDDILQSNKKLRGIIDFMKTNQMPPKAKNLNFIPRVERWVPPENCDMWYSFPTMMATALCSIEAYENGNFDTLSMETLNSRYYDVMHISGVGYGFLWNTPRHIIEELWKIHDNGDMADRVMRYYGRNYLWLTNENSTPQEVRQLVLWSIANGRPVVMDHASGMPEYDLITGYADDGDTLIGWSHCMECAVSTDEQHRFVNPARWNEIGNFRVLIIGDHVKPTYTDADSIAFAIEILNKSGQADSYSEKDQLYVGDAALRKWLESCDTDENTMSLFPMSDDIFTYSLYMNSIYTQKCILSYFKHLDERYSKVVHDIVCQITIAVGRINGERNSLNKLKDNPAEYTTACRKHIENLIKHRADMRVWLQELDKYFKGIATNSTAYQPYG